MKARDLIEDLDHLLDENRSYPPGTIRTWGDDRYEKQRDGKWVRVGRALGSGKEVRKKIIQKSLKPISAPPEVPKKVLAVLKAKYEHALPEGHTFEEHVEIARNALQKHEETLHAKMADFISVTKKAGVKAKIKGRVKRLDSTFEKLARYPGIKTAADLPDLSATRLVIDNLRDIAGVVEKVKENWGGAIWDADYVANPRNGYRSFHLTTRDKEGLEFEVQVRTKNQDDWAEYSHATRYKPTRDRGAIEALKEKSDEVDKYLLDLSAYLHAKDSPGAPEVSKPDCPEVVKASVGCFNT